ncbi:MAG: nucleotidyl transferase AbiEii/AbiGii toxin family protein [Sedimentisphaerales bacterium]|nr:nucleotidyl transferase AbiEii/AbiGii toxin family protein [Sedimentisphaerales bacterium]
MISVDEIRNLAIEHGVPITFVEKDYAMGWLLWGIYVHPALSRNYVFKGGNCLRKIYLTDTRFSDDLDFTAMRLDSEDIFHSYLNEVCQNVSEKSGIEFYQDQTRVNEYETPDSDCKAIDGRVYFKGFAGDSSLKMRIKFDISDYERIVLPLQTHNIIHGYSDSPYCNAEILSYSLEEILAEKLRSWIQRTRARDLFDVVKILQSKKIPISKTSVLSTFFKKTLFKNVPFAGRDEMLFEDKFKTIETSWIKSIICPRNSLIVFSNAISLFKNFITLLFEPSTLEALGISAKPIKNYLYNIHSGWREAIIKAGKARQIIRMRYKKEDRDIEPYSFRFKNTKNGYNEYFFGFDRTRGNHIKMFFLHKIEGVSIYTQQYEPRWPVEF